MTSFESQYFRKLDFTPEQLSDYAASARHDLDIASDSDIPDVIFKFSYDALIKLGIALIARQGYKVRSTVGHHVRIIEKMAQLLRDDSIRAAADKFRHDRNRNLYDGICLISEKDSQEYLDFVKQIFAKADLS